MTTMLIANNCTRESGSFMGDQLCLLKTCYLFVEYGGCDRFIMSVSPKNEMHFLWTKFIEKCGVELVYDDWNPGDWSSRHAAWDKWRGNGYPREIDNVPFDVYKECYLRIHGAQRQTVLCGHEAGLGRRNIYQYWWCGQEGCPNELPVEVDWFDDSMIHHPPLTHARDVWISPLAKTQGNLVFTFEFWAEVVHRLIDEGVSVTVGHEGWFCEDLNGHPLYRKVYGTHEEWMQELCRHRIVACGNTGTGWLAAACGVPMITMEPPHSQMPDHRYRECGLRNIVEVVSEPNAAYVAKQLLAQVRRKVVMTTGCYDVLHAGHIRHLERSRALGTKLVVALNSDESVRLLKGTVEGVTRPINPHGQRKVVLEALRCVDEVRLFDSTSPIDLILEVKPDVLTAGYGYGLDRVVGRDDVESWGGEVVITCGNDAKDEPSTTKIVRRVRAADVAEAVSAAAPYSVNPPDKLQQLAYELLSIGNVPGAVADLGTSRGGTGLLLRRVASGRELYLFDTWEGNPYDEEDCHHKRGEWAASLDGCRQLIGTPSREPEADPTFFRPGVFPDSALSTPSLADEKFAFVYVDPDCYRSVKDAIEFFWPRLAPGGKMVFDDYDWHACPGVKRAVDEAFAAEQLRVTQNLYTCVTEKI